MVVGPPAWTGGMGWHLLWHLPHRGFSVPSPEGAHRTGLTQDRGPGTVNEAHCWVGGSLTSGSLFQNALQRAYILTLGTAPIWKARW